MTASKFEGRLQFFLNSHNALLSQYSSRLSSFFEMKIYNDVVRAYEELGYKVAPKQLGNANTFLYKLSTNGYIENFSYFEIEKHDNKFWVIHNMKCESKTYPNSYITADVAVIVAESHERIRVDKNNQDVVKNDNLRTFFECKFMQPFPELLASFVGMVYTLTPELLDSEIKGRLHIAPSLVCANTGSINSYKMSNAIKDAHNINVFNSMAYRTLKQRIVKREARLIGDR